MKNNMKILTILSIIAICTCGSLASIAGSEDVSADSSTIKLADATDSSVYNISSGDDLTIKGYHYYSSYTSTNRFLTNYPSWLSESGSYDSKVWAGHAPAGTHTLTVTQVVSVSGSTQDTTTFSITLRVTATVTLNSNGGSMSDGQSIATIKSSGSAITLPSANLSGNSFDGWYTAASGGSRVGGSGSSYTPTDSVTLYAHWTASINRVQISSTCYSQVDSGKVFSYDPTTSPSDATIIITNDSTSCLTVVDGKVTGTLTNLLPGTYYVGISASMSGYASASQTITIVVPVFVFDPLTDTIEKDQSWTYNLTANPTAAKITAVTVTDSEGTAVDTSKYTIVKSDKSITVRFSERGLYNIDLTIGAPGYTPTTKKITLNIIDTQYIEGDPAVAGIEFAAHPTIDGGYYFTAVRPVNYNTIVWNFGDGSDDASGVNIIHQFVTSGTKIVTLTLTNTGKNTTCTETVEIVVKLTLKSTIDAWVGVEYSFMFETSSVDAIVLVTDIEQSWLSISDQTDGGQRYILLKGTPMETLENTTLTVNILSRVASTVEGEDPIDTPIKTWTINIWEYVDEDTIKTGFTLAIDGYEVTLTNNGVSGNGVRMFVDWGFGSERCTSTTTASHTYAEAGQFQINMFLLINGLEYKSSGYCTVPTNGETHLIYYVSNGGQGTMTAQPGQSMIVLDCGFTYDGKSFVSWNTKEDSSGTTFMPGDQITPDSDLSLYAIWSSDGTSSESDKTYVWIIAVIIVVVLALIILRVI